MLRLTTEERFRDEKREISILMSGILEHFVKDALHLLPNSISVWFYDHTTPYC